MKLFPGIVALVAVSALLPACKGVPDHVIPPDEMSELLADRHIAEAVVDYNGPQWRTDSQRIALRDAVYLRHGVTQADVDTSLDWYGHNIGRYMEVYDRTIEILESRITGSDARVRAEQVTIAGDHVAPQSGTQSAIRAQQRREQRTRRPVHVACQVRKQSARGFVDSRGRVRRQHA